MKCLEVHPVRTRIFQAREKLSDFVIEQLPRELVRERMVLNVTSKIVSLAEGCLVPHGGIDKTTLVRREADLFLGEVGFGCFLTLKEGLLIPSAGIDESNSAGGDYLLFPKNPFVSAHNLWRDLRAAWPLKELGILITDSHTSPLRRGVTGICLSYWGFRAVKNMVGTKDLFGRELRMTQMNLADGMAAAAVMMMGEGAERQPMAVIHGADVEFSEVSDPRELNMPLEEDLYYPLLKTFINKA